MALNRVFCLNRLKNLSNQSIRQISITSQMRIKESKLNFHYIKYKNYPFHMKYTPILRLPLTTKYLVLTFFHLIFQVVVEKKDKVLEISAEYKPSPRENHLMKEVHSTPTKFCPKCTLGLDIKHTDVLILSQYLRSDGCILPRRITGLCGTQQKNIGTLIKMAQKAGKIYLKANRKIQYGKHFDLSYFIIFLYIRFNAKHKSSE